MSNKKGQTFPLGITLMRNFIFTLTLICILLFTVGQTKAQQSKAFETVRYTARKNNMVFQLYYADGYIGGSKVSLKQAHQKALFFFPESGTLETNGDFILRPQSPVNKREIRLSNINEETEAPATIGAIYHANNQSLNLIFRKVKK